MLSSSLLLVFFRVVVIAIVIIGIIVVSVAALVAVGAEAPKQFGARCTRLLARDVE
jgi:hypothetical protein